MFRNRNAMPVPEPVSNVRHSESIVYKFRKRTFKKLLGIDGDHHDVAQVSIDFGHSGVVKVRMYGDSSGNGTRRTYDCTTYTLTMGDFKSRLGITDPQDVLMVLTGGALSRTIEVTMSDREPS